MSKIDKRMISISKKHVETKKITSPSLNFSNKIFYTNYSTDVQVNNSLQAEFPRIFLKATQPIPSGTLKIEISEISGTKEKSNKPLSVVLTTLQKAITEKVTKKEAIKVSTKTDISSNVEINGHVLEAKLEGDTATIEKLGFSNRLSLTKKLENETNNTVVKGFSRIKIRENWVLGLIEQNKKTTAFLYENLENYKKHFEIGFFCHQHDFDFVIKSNIIKVFMSCEVIKNGIKSWNLHIFELGLDRFFTEVKTVKSKESFFADKMAVYEGATDNTYFLLGHNKETEILTALNVKPGEAQNGELTLGTPLKTLPLGKLYPIMSNF